MQKRNVLKNVGMMVILSFAVTIGLNCMLLFSNLVQYSEQYQEAAMMIWAPPVWQQVLYSGILMPMLEELVFRGIVFRVLRKWIAFPLAMLVSAVTFGVYHGNLVQFVYAGICGVLLAYLYEKYDSIIAPIISHIAMNLIAIVLTQMEMFAWMIGNSVRVLIIVLICGVITIGVVRTIHKMDVTKVLKIYCKEKADDI